MLHTMPGNLYNNLKDIFAIQDCHKLYKQTIGGMIWHLTKVVIDNHCALVFKAVVHR